MKEEKREYKKQTNTYSPMTLKPNSSCKIFFNGKLINAKKHWCM